jgi:hypothetical protein
MDELTQSLYTSLGSTDDQIRLDAFDQLLSLTEKQVSWVYEVWDELIARLDHPNSYQRSIAVMLLCNLAKSDSERKINQSIDKLLAHTKDEKFITSRKCIQNIWKLALVSPDLKEQIIDHLAGRFRECVTEKHYNLLRADIIQSIRNLYDCQSDASLLNFGRSLIELEKEAKHRKKYEAILSV